MAHVIRGDDKEGTVFILSPEEAANFHQGLRTALMYTPREKVDSLSKYAILRWLLAEMDLQSNAGRPDPWVRNTLQRSNEKLSTQSREAEEGAWLDN